MKKTQELAMEILTRLGALKRGHFRLTSGLHSDCYMQCAVLFEHPKESERLCRALAEDFAGQRIDLVASPAVGGTAAAHRGDRQRDRPTSGQLAGHPRPAGGRAEVVVGLGPGGELAGRPGILVGGGDHQLDAVQLVHLRGAWIVVDGNYIGHRVLAAQFGKHAPANHMVRQAGERLGTTEAELATLIWAISSLSG